MQTLLIIFYAPAVVLTLAPYLALLPALFFAYWFWRSTWWNQFIAATMWGAYFCYEMLMYLRLTCSSPCNIRVDLLLIYPVLVAVTCWAWMRYKSYRRLQG